MNLIGFDRYTMFRDLDSLGKDLRREILFSMTRACLMTTA